MQADLTAQAKVWRIRGAGSLGLGSAPATNAASLIHSRGAQLVSRVNWLGIDLGADNEWLVRLGRMNLPFGLRNISHTQWVRSETRTDSNLAQQDGVAVSYNRAGFRGEVMGILGNFVLWPAAYRELGYSGYVEFAPAASIAVGASSLIAHSDADVATGAPMWRHAHGVFARYTPHRVVVVSGELDFTFPSQPNTVNLWGLATMLEVDVEPVSGLHLMATGEARSRGLLYRPTAYGAWGTVAWFLAPHADVRADVVYRYDPVSTVQRTLSLLVQLHFFL